MPGKQYLVVLQIPRWVLLRTVSEEEDRIRDLDHTETTHVVTAGEERIRVQLLDVDEIEEEMKRFGRKPRRVLRPVPEDGDKAPEEEKLLDNFSQVESPFRALHFKGEPLGKPEDEMRVPSKIYSDGTQSVDVECILELVVKKAYADRLLASIPLPVRSVDGARVQVTLMASEGDLQELLTRMERVGLGTVYGTYTVVLAERTQIPLISRLEDLTKSKNEETFNIAAASEMRVQQVKEQIRDAATLSFDYICLVIIASILAGVGLATDNTVVIVASMLVSPIMGPVLGATFGTIVADYDLMRLGLRNEGISLLLCIMVGAVTGFICSFLEETEDSWPTSEMTSRGEPLGLLVGIAIAIPSGVGVALSVLGNNTSSLVGVAISASLLPPAVASGMEWAYASARQNVQRDSVDSNEYNELGSVSLGLTILNIICIYFSALAMFKFKEVAPLKNKTLFWETDVKLNRKLQTYGRDFATSAEGKAMIRRLRASTRRNAPFAFEGHVRDSSAGNPFSALSLSTVGSLGVRRSEKHTEGSAAAALMNLFEPEGSTRDGI